MRSFERLLAAGLMLGLLAGCANADSVARKDADAGTVLSFNADYAAVKDAAYAGLKQLRLEPEGWEEHPDRHVILIARPPHGMSWGEVGRITVEKTDAPPTTVRVVYDRRMAFQAAGGEQSFARRLSERMTSVLGQKTAKQD